MCNRTFSQTVAYWQCLLRRNCFNSINLFKCEIFSTIHRLLYSDTSANSVCKLVFAFAHISTILTRWNAFSITFFYSRSRLSLICSRIFHGLNMSLYRLTTHVHIFPRAKKNETQDERERSRMRRKNMIVLRIQCKEIGTIEHCSIEIKRYSESYSHIDLSSVH